MSLHRTLHTLFRNKHTVGVVSFEYGVVRAVVLSNRGGSVRLVATGEELLPPESPLVLVPLFEKRFSMIASIKRTLSDVFYRHKPGRVIALVPDSLVSRFITRVMRSGLNPGFDHISIIKSHIEAEFRLRNIQPAAVSLEYRVIHESDGLYEIEVSYLAKKDRETIAALMSSVGYPYAEIRSSLGTLPAAYYESNGAAQLFVDIGEQETVLACGTNGVTVSRIVIPVGVSHLAHAVSRFHNVKHEKARTLILDEGFALGLRDNSGLQSELLLALQPLFREIELLLRDHGSRAYRFPSERFVVTSGYVYGSGGGLRGIAEVLSMRTRVPFKVLDVTPHIKTDDDPLIIPASKLIHYAPLVVAGMMELKK